MFDIDIINQDKFLDMPQTTQLLYFHMSMRADDEGFVGNPKSIMRIVGIGNDDLQVLVAKGFVIPFNSGVIVITHWKQNNYLNASRIKPTIHSEEKELLGIDANDKYFLVKQHKQEVKPKRKPLLNRKNTTKKPTSHKQEVKPKPLSRFGENSIEENSIEENSIEENSILLIEHFNKIFNRKYRPTKDRITRIKSRLKTYSVYEIKKAIDSLSKSPWHRGENDQGWTADIDFLIRNDGQIDKFLNFVPPKPKKEEKLDILKL
jgi:hypothetical protein